MKILHIGPVSFSKSINSKNVVYGYYDLIGADGPSRVILGFCEVLSENKDLEVGVISTKDFDINNTFLPKKIKFLKSYDGWKYNFFIKTNEWLDHIQKEFGTPTIINFHGVYDIFSVKIAKAMLQIGWKYFITPHGGLRPIAQNRDKIKKLFANPSFFNEFLIGAEFIHALTHEEMIDIRNYNSRIKDVRLCQSGLPSTFGKLYLSENNSQNKDDKLIIGFIGSLYTKIKGIDLLLRAIIQYQKLDNGKLIKFEFVGPIHKRKDRLIIEKFTKKMKYPEMIEFKGAKFGKDKWDILQNFDILILTSRTEGMPIVVLEAMAYGKAIIVSEGTNMGKFIKNANCGWVVDGSFTSIYKTLISISKVDKTVLKKYGKNARRYFIENFLMNNSVNHYHKMINNQH